MINLKLAMMLKGVTGKQLSIETGLPETTISRWVTGKAKPDLDKLLLVADALEVSLDFLVGRVDSNATKIK